MSVNQRILGFFNAVGTPEALVQRIEQDPSKGKKKGYGLKPALARRVLEARGALDGDRFDDIGQVEAVRGIGPTIMGDIRYSFRDDREGRHLLAVGSDGRKHVVELLAWRLRRHAGDGELIGEWWGGDATLMDVSAENDGESLQRGQTLLQEMGLMQGEQGVELPGTVGLAIAEDGAVYVSEPGANEVHRYTRTGHHDGAWGRFDAAGLADAQAGTTVVDDAGQIWHHGGGDRQLVERNDQGATVQKVELGGDGVTVPLDGVSIDPEGTLFLLKGLARLRGPAETA